MKKLFLVLSLMAAGFILTALNQKIQIKDEEVELQFKNIKIGNIDFYSGQDVEIDHRDLNVIVERSDNYLKVSAPQSSRIDLKLPAAKKYILHLENGKICRFDAEQLEFTGDSGEKVVYRDGAMYVTHEEENVSVVIGKDGITVNNTGEYVEIGEKGIIVEGEENTRLTGFWGQLLGGFVRLVTQASLNFVGKSPEKVVKFLVNEERGDLSFNWSDKSIDVVLKEICKTFKPKKGDRLDIHNLNGSVEVQSWDKDEVELLARLKSRRGEEAFNDVKIEVNQKNNWLISVEHLRKDTGVSVSLFIKAPRYLLLNTVETTNGSIDLQDVQGELNLRASNGSLKIIDVKGSVDGFTTNGSIKVKNVSGKVNVTTSNGSIVAENVHLLKNCITSNGSIKARVSEIGNDILLSTSNARIELFLNRELDAEINAVTSNAGIKVKDISLVSKLAEKSVFEGRLGKGGRKITANTSNGSINIYGLD